MSPINTQKRSKPRKRNGVAAIAYLAAVVAAFAVHACALEADEAAARTAIPTRSA